MLVLSRKKGELIRIGENVEIVVVEIRNGKVRLGINAPKDVTVHRQEIYELVSGDGAPNPPGDTCYVG